MKRVKMGLARKNDQTILPLVAAMITGATGKTEFDDCPIELTELTALMNGGTTALNAETAAREALALKVTERRVKFGKLRTGVSRFADFARSCYEGDKMKLQAVGLDVVEPLPAAGTLPPPAMLRTRFGKLEGSINASWPMVTGRDFYTLEMSSSATGPWTEVYKGKLGRVCQKELTPGAEYFFRVRAWNAAGPGAWSDISKKRAM